MSPKSNVRNGRSNDRAADIRKGVVFVSCGYTPAPYPEDVVNHRHVIIHEELPEDVSCGSQLQVYVRRVNSPSEFWINLCGSFYFRKLITLHTDMRQFYEEKQDRYLLPDYAVLIGQFCVCLYRNEWHRARIATAADSGLVDVCLIDYGGTVTVSTSNLRYMHKKFSLLAIQSFLANLPDIKPRGVAEWPTSVCDFFRQETSGRKLYAEVVSIAREKHLVSLKLWDVTGNSVSEKLVCNDMAEAPGFRAPAIRSLDASFLKLENVTAIPHDASSRFEDHSMLPEGDVPATWRNVTVAEKELLLITIKNKNYFVLSDFLQAFSVLHTHVVLRLLDIFPSRVAIEKMDTQLTRLLLPIVRTRRIRGLSHLSDRGVLPSVHLLPVDEACQLLIFLGEDCSQTSSLRNLATSLATVGHSV